MLAAAMLVTANAIGWAIAWLPAMPARWVRTPVDLANEIDRLDRSTPDDVQVLAAPVLAHRQPDLIAAIDQLEQRLQIVIAVLAPPGDVQKQVQFGRRRPPGQLTHRRQVSMTTLSRSDPRVMLRRCGNHCSRTRT